MAVQCLMLVFCFPQGTSRQEEEGRGGGGGQQPCPGRVEGEGAPGRKSTLREEEGERTPLQVHYQLLQGGDGEGE